MGTGSASSRALVDMAKPLAVGMGLGHWFAALPSRVRHLCKLPLACHRQLSAKPLHLMGLAKGGNPKPLAPKCGAAHLCLCHVHCCCLGLCQRGMAR